VIRRAFITLLAAVCGLAAFGIAGCNGTGYMPAGMPMPTNASATGVWGGTDSVTGLSVVGYIDSGGNAVFIRADGVQFVGVTQVSGATLVAAVVVYANFDSSSGATFKDGSSYGLGTLNGTVVTASTLTLSLSFTTNGGTSGSGSWSLAFNTLSNSGSSLTAISANYTDTASGSVISIGADGVVTGQNPANSCVLNGTVKIINSSYDTYQVSLTYDNCTGSYAVLNGLQLTGLAVFNPNTSPAQLTISVAGASSTSKFGLVLYLTVS
jgi:hypothetical protein